MKTRYQCRTYTEFSKLIKDPGINLITIATPSPFHTNQALSALKAGKAVVIEKPIALTYADAQRLARADKRYPGKIFLRHNRRFEPGFTHIREILATGILGDPFEIKLRRNGYSRRDDWQTIIECGGGQLNNWGPHIIDHALQFLDSPVADVWSDLKRIAAVGDAEDHLKIILRGKNGRIVDLEISGGMALGEPECTIYGSKGALSCSNNQITLKYLDPAVKLAPRQAIKESPPMEGSFGNPDHLSWKQETIPVSPKAACDMNHIWGHVYAAMRQRKPYPVTVAQGVEVVRIADLARRGTPFARPTK
jgi:predicted dehydrogenase